jgi:PilZ domain
MTTNLTRDKSPALKPSGYEPRRRWERLPIAVPVFVHGCDEKGNKFVEFTSGLNINAGGMLLVTRRPVVIGSLLTVEIPTPTPSFQPPGLETKNALPARVLYAKPTETFMLCGLEFSSPLLPAEPDSL